MEGESSPLCGPFSQSTNPQTTQTLDDVLLNFHKLSINEIEINLQSLEKVVQGMKDKSLGTIPLLELLSQLGVQGQNSAHVTPPPLSTFSSPKTPKMSSPSSSEPRTPPKSASSISSSVNSSWSAASFQASPIQFNFQTPQKIFVFETKDSQKVEECDPAAGPPPPDTVPPTIDPPGKGISKSLFFDSNEGGEESKAPFGASEPSQPTFVPATATAASAPSFSFGAPPSNKKTAKLRGNKKSDNTFAGGKPKSLFQTHPQTQGGSVQQNPFTFTNPIFPSQSQPSSNGQPKQEESTDTPNDNDDDMEIGQTDAPVESEANASQAKLWNLPTTERKPFGQPAADTANNSEASQQIPKKKVSSALKRRLKSQKKGFGKEDLSKLDNIFANISLDPNFQTDGDRPQPQEQPKQPFIFFPPPPPTNDSSVSDDQHSSSAHEVPRPQRETSSSDSRKIQRAEVFKREGKDMYSLQRYDLAYHAFTRCLQTAPPNWQDRPNVLSNRAAALIMMERLVEAVADCDQAAALDPQFVKVQTRKGRALLKLGQINEASDSFSYVLSWQPKESEATKDDSDRFGKDLARQAMKQVVLAKTLRERLLSGSCGNNKQILQTAEELLSLCPYMRLAQTYKAQALCQMRKWSEAKTFMELCVCSIHETMQLLYAHPAADFSCLDSQSLQWCEAGYSALQVDVHAVVAAILTMGSEMAKWYAMSLKNQDICRTSCSAESMLRYHDILSRCNQLCLLATTSSSAASASVGDWSWVTDAEKQIRKMISLKNEADEKFRNNLFLEAIQSYSEVLVVDEHAHLWNAIMFGNRAASSMRLGLFHEAVSDCHQSLARDEFYSRAYLRRARAHRALGNHAGSVRDYRKYLKFDPKPADWQTVEEELLEVMRSKNDEERFQRSAPPSGSSWTGSGSSAQNSNRANKPFNFDRTSGKGSSDWFTGDSENTRSSPNKDKKRTSTASQNTKIPSQEPRPKAPPAADVTSSNFYLRLGVDPQATEQEIKTAYRKLALKYHPDKNCSENAAEIFKSVTEAYNQISDRSTRRSYDESLIYQRRSTRGTRR